MENKFYLIRYPAVNKYDIEKNVENKFIEQQEADEYFIDKLSNVAIKNSQKEIFKFLSYHYEETKSSKKEFLDHTEEIFRPNEYKLKPYNYCIGYVYEWIKIKRKQIFVEPQKEIEAKKPKSNVKEDPTFDEIVKDKDRFNKIIQVLKTKEIIGTDLEWRGTSTRSKKNELIALIRILQDNGIIKSEAKALLGRLFSKKFKCAMGEKTYQNEPKNVTTKRIIDEIEKCLY